MCAVHVAAQITPSADLEWWMHYSVNEDDLHLHYHEDLEIKESGVKRSMERPYLIPGQGLFTTQDRKKNEYICGFPGWWEELHLYDARTKIKDSYPFTVPDNKKWGKMHNLVYVTHPCQANRINAAVIGTEVQQLVRVCPADTSNLVGASPVTRPLCLQVLGDLNVHFVFGDGSRGRKNKATEVECLIGVYATKNIPAGTELLAKYGPAYWAADEEKK